MTTNKNKKTLSFFFIFFIIAFSVLVAQSRKLKEIEKLKTIIASTDQKKSDRAIKKIDRRYKNYSIEEQNAAIDAVVVSKSKTAIKFLIRSLREEDTMSIETRDKVAKIFISKGYVGAEAILAEAIDKYPEMSREGPIKYIGKAQFLPAIPLLTSYIRLEENTYESYRALADMKYSKSHEFLTEKCISYEYVVCHPCLTALTTVENNPFQGEADVVLIRTLQEYKTRLPQCVRIAYNYFIRNDQNKEGKAVASIVKNRFATAPSPVIKKKRGKRKKGVYPRNYVSRLIATIAVQTGSGRANELYKKMETGLIENLRSKKTMRAFVIQAYRHGLRLSERKARNALERGSQYPGSIHVIARYAMTQYPNRKVQIYSISQILKISRSEAAIIYNIAKYDKLV